MNLKRNVFASKCQIFLSITVGIILFVILNITTFNPVDCRPSSSSSSPSSLSMKRRQQLSDHEFCTLENFQNCLNVDLFHSSKINNQQNKDSSSGKNSENDKNMPHSGVGTSNHTDSSYEQSFSPPSSSSSSSSLSSSSSATTSKQSTSSLTDLAFPTTLDELSVTCHDLKERVKCLDEHSERCFNQQMMQIFGHIVTNAKQFVYDLCDNRRVQTDEQKCGLEYKDAIGLPSNNLPLTNGQQPHFEPFTDPALSEWLPNPAKLIQAGRNTVNNIHETQNKELFIRRSCCALQELVMCKRRHVREQCGEAASIFMRDHLPRITNPVLEQHCSAFTYGPGTCDETLHRRRMIDGQLVQVQPVMFQQQNHDDHSPGDSEISSSSSSSSISSFPSGLKINQMLIVFIILLVLSQ